MNLGLQRCSSTGWRQCDGIAVAECVICGAAMCASCLKSSAVNNTPCCKQPSCNRLVRIAGRYDEVVANTAGWHR